MADVTLADASDEMYVTKRDGNQEIVSFDKILKRIKNLGQEANLKINYTALVMKVIDQLYDGISTTKIDELSAEQCASMASIHTDYNALAGRISISNHHKNTTPSFVNAMTELYSFLDKQGNHSPLVSQELYEIVCKYPTELEDMIVHDRDYLIDYFGFKTLDRAYLTRINKKTVERPQYMWLRVAIGIHGDNLEKIRETYEYMSQKCFTHATPTLFNAGTPRPQLSSCFEKNTPVNTLRGPIPIKDVKIGDEVITHLGNVKKVVQCHENKIGDRKLYSVFIHKTPEFIVTEDHKLFVYDKKTKTTNWKEVRHLSNSDYIMIPNYNGSIAKSEINVLDVILKHDLSKNDNKMTIELNDDKTRISLRTHWEHCNLNKGQQLCVSKNSTSIYNIISIDNDFMKFLGIWFGDGHIIVYNSKKNNNHRIRGIGFTIHKDNEKLVDFCIGMKDRFGIENVTVHKMKTQNVIQVLYNCPALGILFQELYGKGFAGKKLPDDFYKYDTNLITSFLSGLITTDGCVSASGAITLCMANKKLMFDLYSLCRIHNLDVSKPNPVKCQKLTKTQAYCMTLTNLRNDLVDIWKTYTDDRVVKTAKKPYIDAKRICADGFKYLRFQKRVEVEIDDEHVYTLGVEDDHSYSINGIIAQNCFLLSMEEDSIEGIFNTLKDCALISKLAGGIGLHIHNVRAKGSHIRGTNGSSNGIVPMLRVFNNTAKYVDQCVHPETIIYTTTGPKQIQHCQQGETAIFNLNGTTEIIENVLEHSYEGEFLEIETMHSIFPLRITPEHPIYVLRDQQKGLNYKVITNRLNKNICQFEWIDAKELDDSDMIVYSIPKYEEDINHISEDDCYMYGIILGDGSMSNSTDTSGYVSMHTINKKPVRDFVLKYFEERLVKCEVNVDENTCRIRWNRSIHLPFRYNDFYDETKQKRVNHKWLNLPLQKSKFILKGLLDTDGCNKNELVFDSTSLNLIESVRFICMKMGILTSGYVRDRVGEKHETKRGVIENKKISYCLRIPKTKEICKLMEMQYDENVQFFKFFRHNDYLLTRVKSISSSEYKGVLYDLQMTTEHNYLLHNGVVHNGGGKRNGSFAIYLEPWHADIESFLQMRKNHGDEELKARDLFYALWIPDLFMERIKADANWTLMCPNECPGLADVYGDEFDELYTKYEAEGKGRATVKARQLWFQVLDAQMETGTPYLLYKDACNKKSNQKNIGTIKSSNLCCEIVQVSNEEESAVCNLASIALPAFISSVDNSFDFEKLHKVSRIVTYNLNRVIDINYYPTEKTKRSNLRHRPIGIGVQGLADVFMMLGFPFASDEARQLNKRIFETIYHAALEESCDLARRDGAYETFVGSPASQGILQYDMWNVEPEPGRYDWTTLKTEIQTHGLKNSLLLAPMPTASTSQILGYNECIEPITSNIYNRRTLAGEFILANKYLMQDLVKLDLWNEKIKNNIIANHGSVQHIESIPKEIREKYKTVWEIPMRALIDMAADRGAYVCQSQSLNLWLEDPTYSNLTSMHFYSWSKGLKTGIYYLRRRARHQAQQFTIEPEKKKGESASEEVCEMCSA